MTPAAADARIAWEAAAQTTWQTWRRWIRSTGTIAKEIAYEAHMDALGAEHAAAAVLIKVSRAGTIRYR